MLEQDINTIWDILESNLPPEEKGHVKKTEEEIREETQFLRKANLQLQQEIRGEN